MKTLNDRIVVRGAREHNLKNVDVEIPRDALVVITGLSGSGKSTLAFDTIYAEGQRRYVESLSTYARQFLGLMNKPDVDSIDGLSPAISIDQRSVSKNPRSTVGTVTEIYDYLRLLYARVGVPHCPVCNKIISTQTADQIAEQLASLQNQNVELLAPVIRSKKGTYEKLFEELVKKGFSRVRVDGERVDLGEKTPKLEKQEKHTIEAIVDRVKAGAEEKARLYDSTKAVLGLSGGLLLSVVDGKETLYSTQNACPEHQISLGELQPRLFSFNSPFGACAECTGLGVKQEFDAELVIPDTTKSIAGGAIAPWRGFFNSFRIQTLANVGRHAGFDVDTPVRKLSKAQLKTILHGTPERIQYDYQARTTNAEWHHEGSWAGVIPLLEKQYRETESEDKRAELERYMRSFRCPACNGKRLKIEALCVTLSERNIVELTDLSVTDALRFFYELKLDSTSMQIAKLILKEIVSRLEFLYNVGLDYLTLSRAAATLSGGESQRIRLATQIGSNLTGVLYVLDEPSIGLHQRDNAKLIGTLKRLRDLGNTLLVVEHDEETMRESDWIIDMGPGAGEKGGRIVAQGPLGTILKSKDSLTGAYLRGDKHIPLPRQRREAKRFLTLKGCKENNLKNIDVSFPLSVMTVVTGVSGSGKSTLVNEILYKELARHYNGAREPPGQFSGINGLNNLDKVVNVDQAPIGRTPRSNPATYIGLFAPIRDLYASLPDARSAGLTPGTFSFNVKGGRCETCQGDGVLRIEMQFLPDVYVPCETCKGKRYDSETLMIQFKGKNIADVLEMSVDEALLFFEKIPSIANKLQVLRDVGLGYIKLGQPATTLSGGEAQRIKLSAELSKRGTGQTLYILDEPTTGLHFDDVSKLLSVLHRLVERGNSVLVIEHNLDVIKTADWLIDLGPEGGEGGGEIIAQGTPEQIAENKKSYTGAFLKKAIAVSRVEEKTAR